LTHFKAVISIDEGDGETVQACAPFLKDRRFEAVVQRDRLGWVANTNWLLERAEGKFVAILPHDDLLHPLYLETALSHLARHDECVLVYTDAEAFSDDPAFRPFYLRTRAVRGERFARMRRYMLHAMTGAGFRGVMRRERMRLAGGLEQNPFDDFAADTLWLGKMAIQGELHRLPYPLCKKRYHTASTHTRWFLQSPEWQEGAWRRHCADLLQAYLDVGLSDQEQRQLQQDAMKRLYRMWPTTHF
jgi:hypothetical protein